MNEGLGMSLDPSRGESDNTRPGECGDAERSLNGDRVRERCWREEVQKRGSNRTGMRGMGLAELALDDKGECDLERAEGIVYIGDEVSG